MKVDDAIRIINIAFDYNIDSRGSLELYRYTLEKLNIKDITFTKVDLIDRIVKYKTKELRNKLYKTCG